MCIRDDVDAKYRRPIEKLVRERRGAEEVDDPAPMSPCPYCEKDYDSFEVSFSAFVDNHRPSGVINLVGKVGETY